MQKNTTGYPLLSCNQLASWTAPTQKIIRDNAEWNHVACTKIRNEINEINLFHCCLQSIISIVFCIVWQYKSWLNFISTHQFHNWDNKSVVFFLGRSWHLNCWPFLLFCTAEEFPRFPFFNAWFLQNYMCRTPTKSLYVLFWCITQNTNVFRLKCFQLCHRLTAFFLF